MTTDAPLTPRPPNPLYVAEYAITLSIGQFKMSLQNPAMLTADDFEDVEWLMSLLTMQVKRWKQKLQPELKEPL